MTVSPNFTKDNIPKKISDVRTAFRLEEAQVSTVEDTHQVLPGFKEMVEGLIGLSRKLREEYPEVIGFPLMMMMIPQCQLAKVIPLGFQEDPGFEWDPDWKNQLSINIDRGFGG